MLPFREHRSVLCQKGMPNCNNIIMRKDTSSQHKYIFTLFNVGAEAMNSQYECEVTIKVNDDHETMRGTPTKLLELQLQGM